MRRFPHNEVELDQRNVRLLADETHPNRHISTIKKSAWQNHPQRHYNWREETLGNIR
jgi:hypothetical protein